MMAEMAWRSLRIAAKMMADRRLDITVAGVEHLPPSGPAIIAARHFHHLYDGCALMATVPRPTSILVALDWLKRPLGKRIMEMACHGADWPIVLRREGVTTNADGMAARALRQATRESLTLLAAGWILVVFPEGYPNIDPGYTPKTDEAAFLPFQPGFVRLATIAAVRGLVVPIVPAGFVYERSDRWRVQLTFGAPITIPTRAEERAALLEIEARVRRLSGVPARARE